MPVGLLDDWVDLAHLFLNLTGVTGLEPDWLHCGPVKLEALRHEVLPLFSEIALEQAKFHTPGCLLPCLAWSEALVRPYLAVSEADLVRVEIENAVLRSRGWRSATVVAQCTAGKCPCV